MLEKIASVNLWSLCTCVREPTHVKSEEMSTSHMDNSEG